MKGFFQKRLLICKYVYNIFLSIIISISSIFIFTYLFLKCSFIYDVFSQKSHLADSLSISDAALHKNYIMITDFVSSPFINTLNPPDFNISYTAMIHFYDVKNIFMILSAVFLFTVFILVLQFIITYLMNIKISYKFLYYIPAELITFSIILAVSFAISFNKAFIFFHKLLFRNDYWLFDPEIDTVINMLPEKFFFIAAVTILCCLFIESIILIIINIKLHAHIKDNSLCTITK